MPKTFARTPPTWAAFFVNLAIIGVAFFVATRVTHAFWARLVIVCVVAFCLAKMQERLLPARLGGRRGEARQRR